MSQFRQCGEDEILVRSTERRGRFMTSMREEMGGRVQSWVLAGEKGAVELRHGPTFSCFYVHFPAEPELNILMGAVSHQCHILEGDCWEGLVACGGYDFDAPDADTVPQWPALEELYRFYLEVR